MTASAPPAAAGTSTRPYLIRALHDWCTDNGYTPYIAVFVDASVRVPPEYVKNHEIVLNVGFEATSALQLGNDVIEFKARFGGTPRDIVVPVSHVIAIYARENGQGMAFPAPSESATAGPPSGDAPGAAPAVPHLTLAESVPKPPAPSRAPRRSHGPKPEAPAALAPATPTPEPTSEGTDPPEPPSGGRPALKRVK